MKKLKLLTETKFPKKISSTPLDLNINGVEKNKCTNNAKIIVENNTTLDIKYIEGFMIFNQNGIDRAVPHAWNFLDGKYFDVSADLINTNSSESNYTLQYFPFFERELKDLPLVITNILPFTAEFSKYAIDAKNKYPIK